MRAILCLCAWGGSILLSMMEPAARRVSLSPLWRRVRIYALLLLVVAGTAAATWYGTKSLWDGVRPGVAMQSRFDPVLFGVALLMFPSLLAWNLIRARWSAGGANLTREERVRQIAQCANQSGVRRTPTWLMLQLCVLWCNHWAREQSAPVWKRVAGVIGLTLMLLLIVILSALGVVFIGAGLGTLQTMGLVMVIFGLLLLLFPYFFIRQCVRRKRETGNLRTTAHELNEAQAHYAEWLGSESQKPLRSKLISAAFMVIALSVYWARSMVLHIGHRDWFGPAMWTAFGLYAMWVQFSRPKLV